MITQKIKRRIKQILFLITFIGIFIYIYRESDKRGLVRWIESLKFAIMLAAISSGLIPGIAQESKTVDPNTSSRNASSQIGRVINSEESAQILDLKYLNQRKLKSHSSQALVLSRKIQSVNSNPDSVSPIIYQLLQIRGGDNWKFGPGSKARGAAARNAGKSGGLFVDGFTPLNPYIHQHRYPTRVPVKVEPNPFQPGNGGGNNCGGNGSNGPNNPGKSEYLETQNERIFRECSINPQTGKQDHKSVLETRAVLQAKRKGLLTDVSRPKNPKVDLDFEVKGLGRYENITHVDVKTPASLQALQEQGIKPSGPKTYSKMGKLMGGKLVKQKARFCGLEGGPEGPENVLHIIDFRNIPTYTNKSTIATHLLEAAERAGNTTENILFLNFE